jgi:hypothetical protein
VEISICVSLWMEKVFWSGGKICPPCRHLGGFLLPRLWRAFCTDKTALRCLHGTILCHRGFLIQMGLRFADAVMVRLVMSESQLHVGANLCRIMRLDAFSFMRTHFLSFEID